MKSLYKPQNPQNPNINKAVLKNHNYSTEPRNALKLEFWVAKEYFLILQVLYKNHGETPFPSRWTYTHYSFLLIKITCFPEPEGCLSIGELLYLHSHSYSLH